MRLWSLHPSLLDPIGLVALWREGLLARKVLLGETRGYRNHPQLDRFKAQADPVASLDCYLYEIWYEATERIGYNFNRKLIGSRTDQPKISVSSGQVLLELEHLNNKLFDRAPDRVVKGQFNWAGLVNPFLSVDSGNPEPEPWERAVMGK